MIRELMQFLSQRFVLSGKIFSLIHLLVLLQNTRKSLPKMNNKILLISLAFLLHNYIYGQIDAIMKIADKEKRHAAFIHYFEDNYHSQQPYDSLIREAEKRVPRLKDDKLTQELWVLQQEYKSRTFEGPTLLSAMTPMINAIDEAGKKAWIYPQSRLCANVGNFYHAQGQIQSGFEYLVKAVDLINQLDIKKHPEIVKVSDLVASNYYIFGDHTTALKLYKKGMEVEPYWRNKNELYKIYNNIGLCFQREMKYDSAVYFYTLAHQSAKDVNNEFWTALTDGNKAYCLYLAGDYDAALPPLLRDFELSVQWDEISSAVNAAMTIAAIYLAQSNLAEASKYLEFGKKNRNRLDTRQKINYYRSLTQINRENGNYRQAFLYLDSMQMYKDTAAITNDEGIIRNAELKLGLEKHRHEMNLLESEKRKQILIRNFILIILALTGIIVGLWFYNLHLNRKRDLEIIEQEKINAYNELERSKKELNNFTNLIREKNELIQSIKSELSEIEKTKGAEQRIENINTLLNSNILTDDDWREFKTLFDKIYPGFFVRLKEKYPHLSPAETRLMSLLKLNMSQKDMAFMLGVGYDAIRQSKHRLKNKIAEIENTTLEEIATNI